MTNCFEVIYACDKESTFASAAAPPGPSRAVLPDGDSRILRSHVFGPSGFWTMAPLRYAAKFDPFLGKEGIKFCHLATLGAFMIHLVRQSPC